MNCRLEGEAWRYPERRWGAWTTLIKGDGSVHYKPEKFSIVSQHPNEWNLMVKNAQSGYRYQLETQSSGHYTVAFVTVYGKHNQIT